MSEMVKGKINGIDVLVKTGTTILEAANKVQIKIPVLCKHPDVDASAACGICVVKAVGTNKMIRACCTALEEGMEIITHDPEIVEVRRTVIELILSNHPNDCLQCGRNRNCELQTLAEEFGIREVPFPNQLKGMPRDATTGTIVLDPDKCILCGRCVEVCQGHQDVFALNFIDRGIETRIAPAGDIEMSESPCVRCGQCSAHCPTGAITEYDNTLEAWDYIRDKDTHTVVQVAPAVRVAIGEFFRYEPGTNLTKKLYSALRRMGFDTVFDTNFSADLTIMEEASEFVERFLKHPEKLPLITTCCPAWVDFMEKFEHEMIDNFSTAKSPQQMMGAMVKTYYAKQENIDPKKIKMISIMPCTAKKYEIGRAEDMSSSGDDRDVDLAITTRELSRMIKQAGIDFGNLPYEDADEIMGEYSGAGVIFGATGGVMEAAIRTAHKLVTGVKLQELDVKPVRGLDGVKEAELDIAGNKVRVAVAHGLANVEQVLEKVKQAKENGEELPYHFIEVMACKGGCVAGGGQPYGITNEIRIKRAHGLYSDDETKVVRESHENPMIKKIYKDFLGEPLGKKAHDLLHTHYTARKTYKR